MARQSSRILCALTVCALAQVSGNASAGWVSFDAHLQANNGDFRIANLSDPEFSLVSLTIDLGANAVFDASHLSLKSFDDSGATLTFPDLSSVILDGGSSATFDFTGFDAGDSFAFRTKFVDALDGSKATGYDFNHATVLVTFSNGQTLQAGFAGGPTTPSADRRSFVFTAAEEATEEVVGNVVHNPEPSSVLLLGIGGAIAGGVAVRRRRQATSC